MFFKISRWTVDSGQWTPLSNQWPSAIQKTIQTLAGIFCTARRFLLSCFLFLFFVSLRFLGFLTWNTSLRYNGCLPHFRETAMTTYWFL